MNNLQNELPKCINLAFFKFIEEIGKVTPNILRQSSVILTLFVLNNSIKNRLLSKSNEFISDLFKGRASVP